MAAEEQQVPKFNQMDVRVQELLGEIHDLKLPDGVRQGILDDLQIVVEINGDPDPTRQMFKRVLFSICRNTVQSIREHALSCPVSALVTVDPEGRKVMPWTAEIAALQKVSTDGRSVEHEAWDAHGRGTTGTGWEKVKGVLFDNARLIIICLTIIISALATRQLPSVGDIIKAAVSPSPVSVRVNSGPDDGSDWKSAE